MFSMQMDTTTRASFDNLPEEVIEHIFLYCSFDELSLCLQFVCMKWQQVFHQCSLWRTFTYHVLRSEEETQIIRKLKASPKLRSVKFEKEVSDEVLQALLVYCPEMKKMMFSCDQQLSTQYLKSLVNKYPNLEELGVSECNLSAVENVTILAKHASLKELHILRYSEFACFMDLKPLANGCPALQSLSIDTEGYNVEDIRSIVHAKRYQLSSLAIRCVNDYNNDCALTVLPVCSALTKLTIFEICSENMEAKDECISSMKCLKSLTWIIQQHPESPDILDVLQGGRPWFHLEHLSLSGNADNSDLALSNILKKCCFLKYVVLNCWSEITDNSLRDLFGLPYLQYLSLNIDSDIELYKSKNTDSSPGLKVLRMSSCFSQNNVKLITTLSQLQVLDIRSCDVTGIDFDLFPTHLKHLRRLSLHLCRNLSTEAVNALKTSMPHLHIVIYTR